MSDINETVKNYDMQKLIKEYRDNKENILDILIHFKDVDSLSKIYQPHELLELSNILASSLNILLVAAKNVYIKKHELDNR